jgi:hypothetical protein
MPLAGSMTLRPEEELPRRPVPSRCKTSTAPRHQAVLSQLVQAQVQALRQLSRLLTKTKQQGTETTLKTS